MNLTMHTYNFIEKFNSKNWNEFHFNEGSSLGRFSCKEESLPDTKIRFSYVYDFPLVRYKLPIICYKNMPLSLSLFVHIN